MIPKQLIGANDDYWERFRRFYYPKLHPYLSSLGGYGIGTVTEKQYVASVDLPVEHFEKELQEIGFTRNPIASFKTHSEDGRKSIGSWRLTFETDPNGAVDRGKQLHITLLPKPEGEGAEVYAHYEYDWEAHPFKHLRGKKLKVKWAVDYTSRLLSENSYVKNYEKK